MFILGADHGGFELKNAIKAWLYDQGIKTVDLGVNSPERTDYPDIAESVVDEVLSHSGSIGILVCGTGIGMSMQANRRRGVRAALIYNEFTAESAKAHNNANILCFGGRTMQDKDVISWLNRFMNTAFLGDRYQERLNKLD